jgi:hypothetical protein
MTTLEWILFVPLFAVFLWTEDRATFGRRYR